MLLEETESVSYTHLRMLQGKELYQRDTLVDLVNLASIAYGYSIGVFDADKFEGDTLTPVSYTHLLRI